MTFLVSQGLLWAIVLLLAVAVLALARQVGVLHERIAPVGALAIARGPQPGEAAPKISAPTLAEGTIDIGSRLPSGKLQLLFFVSPTCPVCKTLLPTAKLFAETESLDLVLVGDGDPEAHQKMALRYELPTDRFINSTTVGRAFHVGKLPHAVLISELGIIVAQGLVNTREHLESLMVVHETGLRSVQEYLNSAGPRHQHSGAANQARTPLAG
jgi:methylamine dehydrogenase accessory protein MauD